MNAERGPLPTPATLFQINGGGSMAHDGVQEQDLGRRRSYISPTLIDYGTVAKLTQGSGANNGDGGQNMMQPPCL